MSKILVIGHSVLDRIYYEKNLTVKPGGIYHAVNVLVNLIGDEDEIYLATHYSNNYYKHFSAVYENVNLSFSKIVESIPVVTLHLYKNKEREEKYSSATNQWTWMGGSSIPEQPGVYGTLTTENPLNIPGARVSSVAWSDTDSNLWLFGGHGVDENGTKGQLNDLWKYNISTGNWSWQSGSNNAGPNGVYGTKGIANSANVPGGRNVAVSWVDFNGNFWISSGYGVSESGALGFLNDL